MYECTEVEVVQLPNLKGERAMMSKLGGAVLHCHTRQNVPVTIVSLASSRHMQDNGCLPFE